MAPLAGPAAVAAAAGSPVVAAAAAGPAVVVVVGPAVAAVAGSLAVDLLVGGDLTNPCSTISNNTLIPLYSIVLLSRLPLIIVLCRLIQQIGSYFLNAMVYSICIYYSSPVTTFLLILII